IIIVCKNDVVVYLNSRVGAGTGKRTKVVQVKLCNWMRIQGSDVIDPDSSFREEMRNLKDNRASPAVADDVYRHFDKRSYDARSAVRRGEIVCYEEGNDGCSNG